MRIALFIIGTVFLLYACTSSSPPTCIGCYSTPTPRSLSHREPDNVIATVLISSPHDYLKHSDYYLHLVISDTSVNRYKVTAALSAFSDNFDSYVETKRVTERNIIPFSAPVNDVNEELSARNYSVSMSRELIAKYGKLASVEHAQIAIYGSRSNLWRSSWTNDSVEAVDLSAYRAEEIERMIVILRTAFEGGDDGIGCRTSPQLEACIAFREERYRVLMHGLREPPLATIGRKILDAVTSFAEGL